MPATDPIGPTSHVYYSQRLRLHYNDWGNHGAPPLLLVHGGRDHSRSWDWVAQEMRKDWHVIAPDLRGHGDSQWSPDGNYNTPAFLYDIAQLVHQLALGPITIVAHSMGAGISLRYAGLYPENVARLVAIEGTGMVPRPMEEQQRAPVVERFHRWIEEVRGLSGRQPRRYASIQEALERMQGENPFLSDEVARHLTVHAVARNEDGTYSWKFDNYVRAIDPVRISQDETHLLWARIACPVLLCWGEKSWASHPVDDGVTAHFADVEVAEFADAGHWLHHDRFDRFMQVLRDFV